MSIDEVAAALAAAEQVHPWAHLALRLAAVSGARRSELNWRGWEGERRWVSAESDLALVAVHDPLGRCVLKVIVRGPQASWRLSVSDLAIDVGEELSQAPRDVRAWVGL